MASQPSPLLALAVVLTLLSAPSNSHADDLPPSLFVEGYTNQVSYAPGEDVVFHVSTSAPVYGLNIARIGAEVSETLAKTGIPGALSPIPENASSHGCAWPESFRFKIPADWATGYYSVRFSVSDGGGKFVARGRRTAESQAFFIVRPAEPGTKSKILLQLSTNTYNAYNNWGGGSLYGFHGRANLQGHRVSFLRPSKGQFDNWERPFVAWAEQNGYALDYCANSDLEFHPELLAHYKLVLSVGHDEYWSSPMRDHLEAFITKGAMSHSSAATPAAGRSAAKRTEPRSPAGNRDSTWTPSSEATESSSRRSGAITSSAVPRTNSPASASCGAAITKATASSWRARAHSAFITPITGSSMERR